MNRVFLPDENILIRAIRCNQAAREFWRLLASQCHRIAVDQEWCTRCWTRLRRERTRLRSHYPDIVKIVGMLLHDSEKCEFCQQVLPIAEENIVRHEDDRFLLRIVAAINSEVLLVSTDAKTRADFNRHEIANKFNTRGLTIEQALKLLKER